MRRADILPVFKQVGAVVNAQHFVYTSGRHGPEYINLDLLFPDAELMFAMCKMLAEPFAGSFDTVASPAVGGVVLAELTALAASTPDNRVFAVWADKTRDGLVFDRAGFASYIHGHRILLVEDLLTTGGSLARVGAEAIECGGDLVGASVICNRGKVTAKSLGVPRLESLVDVDFEAYDPGRCPLCAAGVPIVDDIGHGSEFRKTHPAYSGGYVSLLS